MSLDAPIFYCVPDETARVAKAAFPKGNLYIRMRDELGPLYANPDFASLFPSRGRPAEAPARLALVTVMQFVEGLSDRQAADAVRDRLAWKYALALELDDPGFDASVLCEFRVRLIVGGAEALLLDSMLTILRDQGLLKARGYTLAPIQPMSWLPFGSSIAWNVWEKRCATRSMRSPARRPSGCVPRCLATGLTATAGESRTIAYPAARQSGRRWQR
jgi:transposase